jgi:hypothetical protein
MCRNIRPLFNFEPPASEADVRAASEQFVRKLTGMQKPSQANAAEFARAIDAIAAASGRLLGSLTVTTPPRDRDAWSARARTRAAKRFGKAEA